MYICGMGSVSELRGRVVLVSGPPGSGKTTAAATLAAATPNGVHIESDMFYRWIKSDFVAPHLPAAQAQNMAVMDVMSDTAGTYAEAGYAVFIDGVIGPWFVDRVARRLAARGTTTDYLVLRPDRDTALARVRQREQTEDTIGAATMYDQFADLGEYEQHVVDSEPCSASVVEACRAMIEAGPSRLSVAAWIDDRWSVSVKGVIGWDDEFVVLRNDRDEWELPGGRLDDTDQSPKQALSREMREELGLDVEVGDAVDSWIYNVQGHRVLILTYRCSASKPKSLTFSDEHSDVALLSVDDLRQEAFPPGYLASIERVARATE